MDINIFLELFSSNIYIILFVVPFLSQIGIIPFGAMFLIMLGGSLAHSFEEAFLLFLIVLVGSICGDLLGYFIGKKLFHFHFFKKILAYKKVEKVYDRSKKFLKHRGIIAIFLSRFLITGLGSPINYVVGFQFFSFKKFMTWVIFGEILYSLELIFLGYFFHDTFEDILNIISNFGLSVFLAFLLYELGVYLYRKRLS